MNKTDNRVVIKQCSEYDAAVLDAAVEDIFAQLGTDEFLFPGKKVLLKPNLLMRRRPDEATTTHPAVMAAVARAVKRRGVTDIVIADSPSGQYTPSRLKGVYEGCGMAEVAKEENASLNYDVTVTQASAPDGILCRTFPVIQPVLDADVIINVSKLKTHAMTVLSGSVKNLFGCVPGLLKPELHYRFPEPVDFANMLVDLCELVRPTLNICDAVVAMEGDGPSGGDPRALNALVASRSPYAADVACCHLIGMDVQDVLMLKNAIARGLCPHSLDEVLLLGDPVAPLVQPDFKKAHQKGTDFLVYLPKFLRKPAAALVTPKPRIRGRDCIGCGKCAESCPQKIITIKDKKAAIDYKTCIKCYCCHEMCPVKAVDIRRFRFFDF